MPRHLGPNITGRFPSEPEPQRLPAAQVEVQREARVILDADFSALEAHIVNSLSAPLTVIELVHVIYPENCYVTPDVIIGWAHDKMVDAAVDDHVKHNGEISVDADGDEIYRAIVQAVARPSLEEARAFLSDIGANEFSDR